MDTKRFDLEVVGLPVNVPEEDYFLDIQDHQGSFGITELLKKAGVEGVKW